MPCRWKSQGFDSGEECVRRMTGKVDNPEAFCYGPSEALHVDFLGIYQRFTKQFGQREGAKLYDAWITKNDLDDSKPYKVEQQYLHESFTWIKPETIETLNKKDKEAKYYKVRALTANMSMNKNDYSDIPKMMQAARSLSWRPLNINHDHSKWLPFPDARVHFATFEDNAVECVLRIPNYLSDIQYKLENGLILHPSIEGFPLEGYGQETWEGFNPEEYAFTALALLEKGVQLPGDPLTTIDPLTESVQKWTVPITESMGHKLIESYRRKFNIKMNEQDETEQPEQTVKATEIPAEIPDCGPGRHWDAETMSCVDDEIPGSTEPEQTGAKAFVPGPPETMPIPHEALAKILDKMKIDKNFTLKVIKFAEQASHECPEDQIWSEEEQKCVPKPVERPEEAVTKGLAELIKIKKDETQTRIELRDLKTKLATEEQTHNLTKTQLQEAKVKIAELEEQLTKTTESALKLPLEVDAHGKSKRKLEEQSAKISELEKARLTDLNKIKDLEEQLTEQANLEGRLTQQMKENDKLISESKALRAERKELLTKIGELTESDTHHLNELNKTSTDNLSKEKQLQKVQDDLIQNQKEIAHVTEENARLLKDNADLAEKIALSAKKAYQSEQENISIKTENADLKDKLSKVHKYGKIIVKV